MTQAQVTQHLQLEPPTTCLACWLQYCRSRGQAGQGPQFTGSASGSPKREVRNVAARLPEASPISAAPETSGMSPGWPDPCPDPLTNASSHMHTPCHQE